MIHTQETYPKDVKDLHRQIPEVVQLGDANVNLPTQPIAFARWQHAQTHRRRTVDAERERIRVHFDHRRVLIVGLVSNHESVQRLDSIVGGAVLDAARRVVAREESQRMARGHSVRCVLHLNGQAQRAVRLIVIGSETRRKECNDEQSK